MTTVYLQLQQKRRLSILSGKLQTKEISREIDNILTKIYQYQDTLHVLSDGCDEEQIRLNQTISRNNQLHNELEGFQQQIRNLNTQKAIILKSLDNLKLNIVE